LQAYGRPITVGVTPVLRLTEQEKERAADFAKNNELSKYSRVVLFECAPGSKQSLVNTDLALRISQAMVENDQGVCFILSTPQKLETKNPQIIDASILTYRENAALTQYCTLLIGCSSGITWLATSEAAKKIPMIQILNKKSWIFAGVAYDLQVQGLDNSHVIEILHYSDKKLRHCLSLIFAGQYAQARALFHEKYTPSLYAQFRFNSRQYLNQPRDYFSGIANIFAYKRAHRELSVFLLLFCFGQELVKSLIKLVFSRFVRRLLV
jgi:hypothetical protein